MRRYWPLAALTLLLIAVLGVSCYTYPCNEVENKRARESAPISAIAARQPDQGAYEASHTEHAKCWVKRATAWPEGVGAIAVILTLWIIAWQSVETRAAARASEASVLEAKRQGDQMAEQVRITMAKERARLSIIFPTREPHVDVWKIEDVDDATVLQQLVLSIDVTNDGETRAFNVVASGYVLMKDIEVGEIYTSYGSKLAISRVIGGNGSAGLPVSVSLAPAEMELNLVPSEEWKRVRSGEAPLHMIGAISYEDVFGKPHQTPFHCTWKVVGNDDCGDECRWTDHSAASS
jgi:hypothetical protein